MSQVFWWFVSLPFLVIAATASFIMWNFMSTGEWRMRKPGFNPVILYQEQVASLYRQIREEQRAHQAQMDELEQRHRKELQQLRSR